MKAWKLRGPVRGEASLQERNRRKGKLDGGKKGKLDGGKTDSHPVAEEGTYERKAQRAQKADTSCRRWKTTCKVLF